MTLIANPKKEVTVDFPLEEVKVAVSRVHEFTKGKLKEQDDILKQYVISYLNLGIGNIITVNLEPISDSKTKVSLESSRFIGGYVLLTVKYDNQLEVTTAGQDLKIVLKTMSDLLSNPNKERPKK